VVIKFAKFSFYPRLCCKTSRISLLLNVFSLDVIIGELLLRHNCVILPGFGGFIAQRVPARIDFSSGTMHPPGKSILFNRQLINNDGLVVAEFGLQNKLGYEAAFNEVTKQIVQWNEQLRAGRRIELDKVGMLYLDAERNLCFEQDRFFNLLLESFGLSKVHFVEERDLKRAQLTLINTASEGTDLPVIETDNQEDKKTVAQHTETEIRVEETKVISLEHPQNPHPRKRTIWPYVAAACILPIAFYSFWLPMKTDVLESGVISLNDFNPFHQKQEGLALKPIKEASVFVFKHAPTPCPFIQPVEVPAAVIDEGTYTPSESGSEKTIPAPVLKGSYELIIGSFSDPKNVKEHVALLQEKGIQTTVLGVSDGLIRISAGTYKSMDLARAKKEILASSGVDAWIMKSK
jgi:hypothetical protein